jgi:lipid-A-disaccharide synthase
MKTVMIVSGESSGELYGSLLAKALRRKMPDIHIMGVGGERMDKVGVELISGTSDAFGIVEAFSVYRKVKTVFKKTVDAIKNFMPDVLVLIDYPDFNLKVAKVAKPLGIKILYYVSPQVWAWRKGRVKKIASVVDRMAVILPFEEEIYRKAGVRCEFVGHPILEEIESVSPLPPHPPLTKGGQGGVKAALGLNPDRPLLSLLPGSRHHELKSLLPIMVDVVRQFKSDPEINSGKDYQFCIPLAPNTDEGKYSVYLEALRQEGVAIKKGESIKALAASNMAVIASGTATLQAAFLGNPMVVVYKLSPLTYLLGRLIVDVRYISLVNLLSNREVVPELLQDRANPQEIIKELKKIMFNTHYREEMLDYYRSIKKPFSGMKASERVADIIMEMA